MSIFELLPSMRFEIEGEFLGFAGDRGESKYMRVALPERELEIKLSKELRRELQTSKARPGLQRGDRVRVFGFKKFKKLSDKPKFKAEGLIRLSCMLEARVPESKVIAAASNEIIICQNSGCLKRGGKSFSQELEEALSTLGLQDSVKIKKTGCQKQCKKAPFITLMPSGITYDRIPPNAIVGLLKKHFQM